MRKALNARKMLSAYTEGLGDCKNNTTDLCKKISDFKID